MQQSLSFLLVGVFASAAVQRYVFGHATAEFVDVVFFVVLGALFTATTQTIVPRRDLTTLSGTQVASVLTLMPVDTLLSISNGAEGRGRAAHPLQRREFALLRYPIVHCVADARPVVLLVIAPDDTPLPLIHGSRWRACSRVGNYRGGRADHDHCPPHPTRRRAAGA